jgi:replicative DNA helicase
MAESEVLVQLNDVFTRFKKGQYQSNFKLPEVKDNEEKGIQVKDASQAVASYYEHIKQSSSSSVPELCTGFTELDKWTWGIRKGEVYTVGARPGTGKSSFLITVANSLLKQGKRVLFVSTEMPEQEVITKLIAVEKEIPCESLITGTLDTKGAVQRTSYLEYFAKCPWHFCNIYEPNDAEIRKVVEQVQPDVLIFDHLQHIASGDEAHKSISKFIRALKSLAMEYGVAVMVASQLNRLAGGAMPELHHLKECGTIEEESCVVVLLHKEDQSGADEIPVVVKVAKNRYGKVGVSTLIFKAAYTKFEDMNYDKSNQGNDKPTEQAGTGQGLLGMDTPKQEGSVGEQSTKQEEKS